MEFYLLVIKKQLKHKHLEQRELGYEIQGF